MRPITGKTKAALRGVIGVIALVLFFGLPHVLPGAPGTASVDAPLEIHVIDVGQGDAMLLMSEDATILIDAGTNQSEGTLRAHLDFCDVERIDYFVISHPHEDHMGGADMVLREYDVQTLIMLDLAPDADVGMSFTTALLQSEAQVLVPAAGEVLELGDLRLIVLAPPEGGFSDGNDNSLVVRCEYGDVSLLAVGDAERDVEAWLLTNADASLLDVDLLKAGHHGSATSTSADFLAALTPDYVTISCGRGNTYNHPVQSVLDAIAAAGAVACRTDVDGTLVFASDGVDLWRVR